MINKEIKQNWFLYLCVISVFLLIINTNYGVSQTQALFGFKLFFKLFDVGSMVSPIILGLIVMVVLSMIGMDFMGVFLVMVAVGLIIFVPIPQAKIAGAVSGVMGLLMILARKK